MKYKDYYATLGVSRDADLEAIKKAYRKLARQHHPDVSKDSGSEARFKEAAEAYATLKNPETRAAYDALGQQRAGAEFSPPPHWQDGQDEDPSAYGNQDLADLLEALARRHGSGRHDNIPVPGRSYEDTVYIGLAQAHRGTTLHLNLADPQGDKALEVTIPAGVTAGQKLRLRGKGGKGRNGGADGDIFLHIAINPDPVFRLDGRDLYFVLALAPWEAALGTALEVTTLDGPVVLTVPAGSSSGRKLRLRGRGLANSRGEPGDLYATVRIDVPPSLSEPQRKLYQELEQLSGFNPRENSAKESAHV
jgi:curved DNA-binding protein